MKIICIIRLKPTAVYFVNKINSVYKVSMVIIEKPKLKVSDPSLPLLKRIAERIHKRDFLGILYSFWSTIINMINNLVNRNRRIILENTYNTLFEDKWKKINPDIPILWVDNINGDTTHKILSKERPDILVDHGTSIVKPHILSCAKLALNIHWGLSPYYRGTHCTNWALLKRDPYNIGVTIHKLSKEIDGGGIFQQARVIPEPNDTVYSINAKLTKAGTDIMIKALGLFASNKPIDFHPQDLSIGLLTYSREYTEEVAKKVYKIEKKGLRDLLDKPSRTERLPILDS